ncbi:hypothetical protein JRO89_XS15G0120600 [Xanthoceras sorbifolium]|uniref:Uncharacterized protein n=1 Tax=Xanthoceras sorbifolium TaxID=99658 RepID=A0ABQ8H1U2_9ROSI|nr:hypothetical protein JRO89_XS15G0120600 [Xanthoceras sorbifolium]
MKNLRGNLAINKTRGALSNFSIINLTEINGFFDLWVQIEEPNQIGSSDQLFYGQLSQNYLKDRVLNLFFVSIGREMDGSYFLRLEHGLLSNRGYITHISGLIRLKEFALLIRSQIKYSIGEYEETIGTCFVFSEDEHGIFIFVSEGFMDMLTPTYFCLFLADIQTFCSPAVKVLYLCVFEVLSSKFSSPSIMQLFDELRPFLPLKREDEVGDSGDDDVVVLGTIGLLMGFSAKFFELGSSVECCQGNRKVLFRLHEEFLKLEKDLASSGVNVLIPEVSVDDDEEDEVPTLVPIANDMEVDATDEGVAEGSTKKVLKKCKKSKKGNFGEEEKGKKPKKKKKKNVESSPIDMAEENVVSRNGDFSVEEQNSVSNLVSFNEVVMSNLQMQFEKVAAEVGMDGTVESSCGLQNGAVNGTLHKKRKRAKGSEGQQSQTPEPNNRADAEGPTAKSAEKSGKKVRFSMKNNLVWKPQSPLPPQSLRLPPSVTPRGSALKKGVAPGPVREMPVTIKKAKQRAKSMKKVRKVIKIKNPALKNRKTDA